MDGRPWTLEERVARALTLGTVCTCCACGGAPLPLPFELAVIAALATFGALRGGDAQWFFTSAALLEVAFFAAQFVRNAGLVKPRALACRLYGAAASAGVRAGVVVAGYAIFEAVRANTQNPT